MTTKLRRSDRLLNINWCAGVPAGVLSMVFGSGAAAGSAITQHPDVPLISFTGSTATGAKIASITAPLFKKISLEVRYLPMTFLAFFLLIL
jgi:acyl-CoA reductase-like NAD-dependent aldehyde dehydrogenase